MTIQIDREFLTRQHDRDTDIGGLGMSAPRYNDRIEEIVRVDSTRPIELSIENQNGDVLVRGSDRDDVLIRAEKLGNRSSVIYQETHLKIEADDARIRVSPVIPPGPRGGPAVDVGIDLDLDFGPDFVRDLLGASGFREDREQRRKERRERRGRGFRFKWDNNDVSYQIEIDVPRTLEYRLDISTASGDVDVRDVTGAINLNTASGDAALSQVVGDLTFNTASGDLKLQRAAGQATVRSASGDARIERSAFNAFGFHTASGDLHLDAALTGDGPYRLETVSGDSRLAIAVLNPATGAERGLDVSFQSMSGDARLDREFQRQSSGRWLITGAEPGPQLAVSSVSGDLHAKLGASPEARSLGLRAESHAVAPSRAAPPVPPSPPAPPAPVASVSAPAPIAEAAPDDAALEREHVAHIEDQPSADTAEVDRLALLEAVERGEIDIEEALQRLEDRKDANVDQE